MGCGVAAVCSASQYLFVSKPGFGFEIKDTIADMRYIFVYAVIVIVLFCVAVKTKVSKKGSSFQKDMRIQYMVFYVVFLICLGAVVGSSYLLSKNDRIYDDVQLNYWFVLIVALVVNKDYYIIEFSKKVQELVDKR